MRPEVPAGRIAKCHCFPLLPTIDVHNAGRESFMFITDDRKHDSHAVQHFVADANKYLQDTRHLHIERIIHFSDGAPKSIQVEDAIL